MAWQEAAAVTLPPPFVISLDQGISLPPYRTLALLLDNVGRNYWIRLTDNKGG